MTSRGRYGTKRVSTSVEDEMRKYSSGHRGGGVSCSRGGGVVRVKDRLEAGGGESGGFNGTKGVSHAVVDREMLIHNRLLGKGFSNISVYIYIYVPSHQAAHIFRPSLFVVCKP